MFWFDLHDAARRYRAHLSQIRVPVITRGDTGADREKRAASGYFAQPSLRRGAEVGTQTVNRPCFKATRADNAIELAARTTPADARLSLSDVRQRGGGSTAVL